MSEHNPYNPYDRTIRDPIDPEEQAIEDPMHGPSAVHAMLETPAMPLGNGTYYKPGAYYTTGTAYVDSQDKPVFRTGYSIMTGIREARDLQEWLEASREGDEALTELEAERQRKRLEKNGVARCYKTTDVCPGGEKIADCNIGNEAFSTAQKWATNNAEEKPDEGAMYTVLVRAGSECVKCSVLCEVAVKTVNGKPEETRVSYYKPDSNIPTIKLDLF